MNNSQISTEPVSTAMPKLHPSRLFPVPRLSTLLAIAAVLFLIYAFFTRITMRFYASAVFLFYSLTKSMWISVVMLGIFQTLLMIPLRVINLLKSKNLKEFEQKFKEIKLEKDQQYLLKKSVKSGRRVALFYLVNFFIQVTSYASIGRLFLTDYYSQPLNPNLLYSFVPYPDYPIKDRFFKIPYPWFTEQMDFGMKWVLIAWGIVLGIQAVIFLARNLAKRVRVQKPLIADSPQSKAFDKVRRAVSGRFVLLMLLAWVLLRNFPVGWELRIFSGDVSIPNPRFNSLTAIATFLTLIWVNLPRIQKKSELAYEAGLDKEVIDRTEKQMFRDTFQVALFVGLGAFFITNQIPSAFELSIFTLEMISLFSPLTLDRIILSSNKAATQRQAEESVSEITKSEKSPFE